MLFTVTKLMEDLTFNIRLKQIKSDSLVPNFPLHTFGLGEFYKS